jgi:hypothetical protein
MSAASIARQKARLIRNVRPAAGETIETAIEAHERLAVLHTARQGEILRAARDYFGDETVRFKRDGGRFHLLVPNDQGKLVTLGYGTTAIEAFVVAKLNAEAIERRKAEVAAANKKALEASQAAANPAPEALPV